MNETTEQRDIEIFKKRYYDYIDRTLDRLCIIFYGQPRYVGSPEWEKETLSMYSELKKDFPDKPIDVFFAVWEYDSFDRHILETENFHQELSGLPVKDSKLKNMDHLSAYQKCEKLFYDDYGDNDRFVPKIKAKKDVFEKYIKEKFSFADTITFNWYNPYELAEEYNKEYRKWGLERSNLKAPGINNHFNEHKESTLMWLNQHAVMEWIYRDNKEYFDNLSRNSVILKIRYDIARLYRTWSTNSFTFWNLVGTFFLGLTSQELKVHNLKETLEAGGHNYFNNIREGQILDLHPAVAYASSCSGTEVLKGVVNSADYWFVMDPKAFRIYATRFKSWVFDLPVYRYCKMPSKVAEFAGRKFTPETVWEIAPERMIHDFFIANRFTLIPAGSNHWLWEKPHYIHYRNDNTEIYDLHRWYFYDWDIDKINILFDYDENLDIDL